MNDWMFPKFIRVVLCRRSCGDGGVELANLGEMLKKSISAAQASLKRVPFVSMKRVLFFQFPTKHKHSFCLQKGFSPRNDDVTDVFPVVFNDPSDIRNRKPEALLDLKSGIGRIAFDDSFRSLPATM